ncbi:MAG: FMN-binding negative transcriptional regulator [Kofleriaceae bacterium]
MYTPRAFRQDDPAALAGLVGAFPLATLVSVGPGGLVASHLPLRAVGVPGPITHLRGHLARANPHVDGLDGAAALAVFTGPAGYVSPSAYAQKATDGAVVPTWDYAVVHAHGQVRIVDDVAWLRAEVAAATATHEASRAAPWSVDDAPPAYLERMLGAIVGVELAVARLDGKWKLSQNRSDADRAGVVADLAATGAAELSAWVARAAEERR